MKKDWLMFEAKPSTRTAATIEAGWAARDRERTTGALDDALVEEIAILGTADECRARVRELAAGGITEKDFDFAARVNRLTG